MSSLVEVLFFRGLGVREDYNLTVWRKGTDRHC